MSIRDKIVDGIISRLPYRLIEIDGDAYLLRFFPFRKTVRPPYDRSKWPAVYLHKFLRPDRDRELHSHPNKWSFSIILKGSYTEERRRGNEVFTRRVRLFNFLGLQDFHRIDELHGDVWTLFFVGPKVSSWGFWDRDTNEVTPHHDYLNQRRRLQ